MNLPLLIRNSLRFAALFAAFTTLQAQTPREALTGPGLDGETVIPPVDLSDPEKLGKTGDDAFAREEWMTAAANYRGLITIGRKVGVNPNELEPLYFMVGFSVFFVPDYDEALKRLKEYETLYPAGPKIDDVKLGIARSCRAQKQWAEAIKYYKPLSDKPELRDEVLVELAEAYRENKERDKAITFLETQLATGVKSREEVRAVIFLADLYDSKPAKGIAWLEKLGKLPAAWLFEAEINMTSMKLAEVQMKAKDFFEALRAYQLMSRKNGVVTSLKKRVDEYERDLGELSAQKKRKGASLALTTLRILRIKALLEDTRRLSAAIAKEAHYDAVVAYGRGRSFTALQRYHEAAAAFEEVYANRPEFNDRPGVLFALAYCHYMLVPENPAKDDLKMVDVADKLLVEFLLQWGKERTESSQVADMRISLATRTKDNARLNKVLEELDAQLKGSPAWSTYMTQRIHTCIAQKDFGKAKALIEKFLTQSAADDSNRQSVEDMKKLIPEQK